MQTAQLPTNWLSWCEKDKKALLERLKVLAKKKLSQEPDTPLWSPHPENMPQQAAYASLADEMYYGGSAGGGKTDLALGLAVTRHRRTLFLRREATQLRDVIDRSQELLGTAAKWNGQMYTWRNIPGDRLLEFGGCDHEWGKNRYKGRAHDLKVFDEGSDFTESQYLFISAWNRTTIEGQRCRILLCGNPPTSADGEWVLRRWAPWLVTHEATPGEVLWFTTIDGKDTQVESGASFQHKGETLHPRSRTFIPASLKDNVFLMRTGYEQVLQAMPEPYRSQLLYGDFEAGREDDAWQVIPTEWIKQAQARWTPTPPVALSSVGVDVARGGRDKTVVSKRYGNWFAPLNKIEGKMTPDGPTAAAFVVQSLDGQMPTTLGVDIIGVGGSAYDQLRSKYGSCVQPVNVAESSTRTDKSGKLQIFNLRAESLWLLREALDPTSGQNIALPPDDELRADLAAARWTPTVRGIKIEDKEEIRKRIGRSPDCSDALAIAHLLVHVPISYETVSTREATYSGRGAY